MMHYPKFFDYTMLCIPLTWERIKLKTKKDGVRNFGVLYTFGFRLFVRAFV